MTQVSYEKECKAYLENLLEVLEQESTDLDIDFNGKILVIQDSEGKEYVLNYHEPTNQLWMSSPLSGAHHFNFIQDGWISTRSEQSLGSLLAQELSDILNQKVSLT